MTLTREISVDDLLDLVEVVCEARARATMELNRILGPESEAMYQRKLETAERLLLVLVPKSTDAHQEAA